MKDEKPGPSKELVSMAAETRRGNMSPRESLRREYSFDRTEALMAEFGERVARECARVAKAEHGCSKASPNGCDVANSVLRHFGLSEGDQHGKNS
jgi:hypothetical protein